MAVSPELSPRRQVLSVGRGEAGAGGGKMRDMKALHR